MTFRALSVLGFVWLSACGTKPAASPEAPAEGAPLPSTAAPVAAEPREPPPDFEALLARESKGLVPAEVKGPNGAFTARVSAAGTPEATVEEGVAVVQIPIGSDAPVRCQVFPEDVDAGGTLAGFFGDARSHVEFQRMAPWSVTVIHGAPAAFVRATYAVARGKGKALGEIKTMFHAASRHAVLCLHDELGYEKTFAAVATEFSESIAHQGAAPAPPQLVEVHQLKVQNQPIGFSRNQTVKEDGKTTHVSIAFVMFPISESEVHFGDYVEMQELDAAGRLKTGVFAKALNGKVELQMQVDQVKGGEYKYSGQANGKPASGTFTTKDKAALPGYLLNAKKLAPYAKGAKPFSFETFEYTPDVDAAAPTPVRYHRDVGDAAGTLRVSKPKQERTGTLDAAGLVDTLKVPVGQLTMEMTRVFVEGKP